ncbi:flagellar basal body P-ring protein FlgI [Aquicella siphonis]|nr:flagellar basal body P-ring protein FlgI [Aquicella siphonis]
MMRLTRYLFLFAGLILPISISYSTRIKDITNLAGVRDNQLVGYGLVVGLDGTGDRVNQTPFTQQSFTNMLLQFGIRLPVGVNLQLKNVAAVALSASLPPFARIGQKLDVTVASLGNATSLRSGELLMTPLRGADGQTYAVAQGSVVVSGFGAQGSDGSKVIVNSTSSGRIPNGATIEKTIDMPFVKDGAITFELSNPDFTTAERIEQAINHEFGRKVAHALDASSVRVKIHNLRLDPNDIPVYHGDTASYKSEEDHYQSTYYDKRLMSQYVPIISRIENIKMQPADIRARVIANSRTGTIVVDQNVSISPVAVAHGNLSVVISERPYVSQPNAFASGKTVTGKASDISINQTQNHAFLFAPGASLNDLVNAINSVGAAPGDIIAILEAIKAAGALHADLEII